MILTRTPRTADKKIEALDKPGGSTSQEDIADVTLPSDFDWEAYIAYHPGVYDIGVVTEVDAIEHYMEFGSEQGLLHHRVNVILRYTACTGCYTLLCCVPI